MSQADPDLSTKEKAVGVAILAVGAFVVIGGLLFVINGWVIVEDGQRGVYTRMGEVQGTVGPGFHPKIPLIDSVKKYDVRKQAYTMSTKTKEGNVKRDDAIKALTQEGLNIRVDMTVRWRNNPGEVDYLYENVGKTNKAVVTTITRPTSREAIRSCSAQYSVEEIYSNKRAEFQTCVKEDIKESFEAGSDGAVMLEAVQIRNIMLPQKVRKAIQKKQSAQERIQTKQKQLEIEKLEKQRRIIEAEGIRKSQKIIDKSLTKKYLYYLWIKEGIEKGDPIYVPTGNQGMPIFKDVDKYDVNPDGQPENSSSDEGEYNASASYNSSSSAQASG